MSVKLRRAYTLVELVVVLAVIAVVTHLAVREMGRYRDSRLSAAADRQLEEIRKSVYFVDSDGVPGGFLADMGRLPRDLEELWRKPDDAGLYVVSNIEDNVCVPTGWRGPYLRLPLGRDVLLDPWGNEFSGADSAGLQRVFRDSSGFVTNIAHYGSRAQSHSRCDLSLPPDGGATSTLVVTLATNTVVSVAWFGPDGYGGVTNSTHEVSLAAPWRFEGLTPGIRIIRDGLSGIPRQIVVRPGENLLQLPL